MNTLSNNNNAEPYTLGEIFDGVSQNAATSEHHFPCIPVLMAALTNLEEDQENHNQNKPKKSKFSSSALKLDPFFESYLICTITVQVSPSLSSW